MPEDKGMCLEVLCPGCRKKIRYDTSNPFRPFCSKACKSEDLLAWAEENYRVAGSSDEDEKLAESGSHEEP